MQSPPTRPKESWPKAEVDVEQADLVVFFESDRHYAASKNIAEIRQESLSLPHVMPGVLCFACLAVDLRVIRWDSGGPGIPPPID